MPAWQTRLVEITSTRPADEDLIPSYYPASYRHSLWLKLGGEFHNFRLVEVASGAENALGNEVDLFASWAYRERFVPTVGVSAFMAGDAMNPSPSVEADNSYWFYAQGTVSF